MKLTHTVTVQVEENVSMGPQKVGPHHIIGLCVLILS